MNAIKYHVNPDTGNANLCNAHIYDCKYGISEDRHYSTKPDAKEGSELDLKAEFITKEEGYAIMRKIEKSGSRVDSDGLSFDGVEYNYRYIKDGFENFEGLRAKGTLKDLTRVGKIAEILDKDEPSDEDFKYAEKLLKQLQRSETDYCHNEIFESPRNRLKAYAEGLIIARKIEQIPEPDPAPQRVEATGFVGLSEAQKVAVGTANMYDSIGNSALNSLENTLNRISNGEELDYSNSEYARGESESTYERPKHDRLMHFIENNSQTYLATAWAENELHSEMVKQGVENVKVDSFYNTREWGNVYTVDHPDGGNMSFSVYEHRNSDAIIINGKKNWDGEELPYVADSKYEFFAEIPGDDKVKAAQILTYFMKETQKGEIQDEATLANSAMRIDWVSVLSEKIPGFGKWAEEHGHDVSEAKTDEDILKRLDFDS